MYYGRGRRVKGYTRGPVRITKKLQIRAPELPRYYIDTGVTLGLLFPKQRLPLGSS